MLNPFCSAHASQAEAFVGLVSAQAGAPTGKHAALVPFVVAERFIARPLRYSSPNAPTYCQTYGGGDEGDGGGEGLGSDGGSGAGDGGRGGGGPSLESCAAAGAATASSRQMSSLAVCQLELIH